MDDPSKWLPPGQAPTRKFPVVGEKHPSSECLDETTWRLEVDGLVERPRSWTLEDIRARPTRERVADIHCVTGWSHREMHLEGFPLADLLDEVGPLPEAAFVRFLAYSEHDHDTTLPLEVAREDTWLVNARDGVPLSVEHGGPLRSVTPSRYFYKSLKWIKRIELLAEDRLGTWERESSYHQVGDPWTGDQRFATGSLAPERVRVFREAASYGPWRGPRKVFIGLDLKGWAPATKDLGALQLKRCDLRQAALSGSDLREANLSLSDLRGADLVGVDFRGADLEGVDFRGADLRGADLRGTALTATRFTGSDERARVDGLLWTDGSGLLEDQEAFLRAEAGPGRAPSEDGG